MAMIVGEYYHLDPTWIYQNYYPNQLVSTFSYIVNKRQQEKLAGMNEKDKVGEPEVLVERILTEEEMEKYKAQRQKEMAKRIEQEFSGKGSKS